MTTALVAGRPAVLRRALRHTIFDHSFPWGGAAGTFRHSSGDWGMQTLAIRLSPSFSPRQLAKPASFASMISLILPMRGESRAISLFKAFSSTSPMLTVGGGTGGGCGVLMSCPSPLFLSFRRGPPRS